MFLFRKLKLFSLNQNTLMKKIKLRNIYFTQEYKLFFLSQSFITVHVQQKIETIKIEKNKIKDKSINIFSNDAQCYNSFLALKFLCILKNYIFSTIQSFSILI